MIAAGVIATEDARCSAPLALGGCGLWDDWFGTKKTPLPGKREPILRTGGALTVDEGVPKVVLPPPVRNAGWPQAGGNPAHFMGHLAAGAAPGRGLERRYRRRRRLPAQDPRPARGGRRHGLHDGLRRRGVRVRDRRRRAGLAVRHQGTTRTTAPMSAAASRSTRARCTRSTAWPNWWRWMPPRARCAGAAISARRRARRRPWPRAGCSSPRSRTGCWRSPPMTAGSSGLTRRPIRRPSVLGRPAPAYADGLVVAGFGSGELATLRADSGTVVWTDSLATSAGSRRPGGFLGDPRPAGDRRRPGLRHRRRRPDWSRSTCRRAGGCGSARSPARTVPGRPGPGCSSCRSSSRLRRSTATTAASPG